jgi:hypothetical protein
MGNYAHGIFHTIHSFHRSDRRISLPSHAECPTMAASQFPESTGGVMTTRLTDQLEQVQKDLARDVNEVTEIGERLIELGLRLKREPWKWSIDWMGNSFVEQDGVWPIEAELAEVLDKPRLSWLLEEIRLLRRRAAELKKLAVA